VRGLILVMVVAGGCVAADPASSTPGGITAISESTQNGADVGMTSGTTEGAQANVDVRAITIDGVPAAAGSDPDLCGLASQLSSDDPCSLICDPDALAAKLLADGSTSGRCYELFCALTDDVHVQVGVCLPPPS
jgi:hypothetical protein